MNGDPPDMPVFRTVLVPFALLTFCGVYANASLSEDKTLQLNADAFNQALALIEQGRFVADKNGSWKDDHPSRSQESEFIRQHGFAEYAKWYLAIDRRHGAHTKAGYKFPFGDFQNVHRCGLLAVKARAHQYGYDEIEAVADTLLERIAVILKRQRNSTTAFGRTNYRSGNEVR